MKKLLTATLIVLFCIKLTYAQRISPYQSGSYYPEKVVNRSGYIPFIGTTLGKGILNIEFRMTNKNLKAQKL